MPRRRVPTLTRHKATGQAKSRWNGRDHYFGPWGSAKAEAAFGRFVADVMRGEDPDVPAARRAAAEDPAVAGPLTVTGLVARYRDHLESTHVGPDGKLTRHVDNARLGLRPWRRAYGHLPVGEFGPLKLAELRDALIAGGLARRTVQQRVGFVVGCVRWGVSRELVEPAVLQKLEALEPLRKGRSKAREPEPVRPAPDEHLAAALPHMPAPVAAMVRLQRWGSPGRGKCVR